LTILYQLQTSFRVVKYKRKITYGGFSWKQPKINTPHATNELYNIEIDVIHIECIWCVAYHL